LIIFYRVSSCVISTTVSSCEFFSATVEAAEGRTKVVVPLDFSSSLRENGFKDKGVTARNIMQPKKNNLRVSFKEVEQSRRRILRR
jgi:hypothetical protein